MFALCAALVTFKYFAKVQLSFLIVGHTHEDIDQKFSTISGTLKSRDRFVEGIIRAGEERGFRYRGICNIMTFGVCLGLEVFYYTSPVEWS